jgi:hypothetical protein
MKLSPTSGPAGTPVTVTAGGFPPSTLIELTYSYAFYPFGGGTTTHSGNWTTSVNSGSGSFASTFAMLDSKQAYNPNSGVQAMSAITIMAKVQASPHTLLASAAFNENTRVLTGVKSFASGGGVVDFNNPPPGPYGNDTSGAGSNLLQPIGANVLGTLNIAGNHFMASSTVNFLVNSAPVGSAMTNATGHFNATISVPVLPSGTDTVKVVNNGVTYVFSINILPTLVLTPSTGPVGTHVTAQAYGFPANTKWFLYWHEHALGDLTWYQVAHGTTGATGSFNVTVSFTVPNAYGGGHSVSASTTNVTTSSPGSPAGTVALVPFTITASTGTTVTATTTQSTTVTQSTTQTVTQPSTLTTVSTQSTTSTRSTTQTQVSTQETTTTTSEPVSTATYATLGAVTIVIAAVAALAAWVLRGRRA